MAEIKFFTPTKLSGRYEQLKCDAHLLISIKGEKRKSTLHIFYIFNLIKKYNLKWEYARIGIWNENIYMEEGTELDGYQIHRMRNISNKTLVYNLFNGLKIDFPVSNNSLTKVRLGAKKFQKGFLLTTI
jgi:hypothetical protein